jgi:DNA-binding NtrC family response regulator
MSHATPRAHILVIDDDRSIRRSLEKFLGELGYAVTTAEDGTSGMAVVDQGHIDLVLLDLGLPGMDGLELLGRLQGREGVCPIVVITARDDMRSTIAATQKGAWDYLVKPLDIERLKITIRRALESSELSRRIGSLVESMSREYQVDNIVGKTPEMREVFKTIGRVSTSNASVLVTGESGTGKELVARAIHYASDNRDQPFVAVNCTAFARDLLESELFGHVRGAFTGAASDKVGRFQLAGSGSLFLDEIGELPMELQVKLLRVVQERSFERVGDSKPMALRARIIAATHRDLSQMVREGTFREDLLYRLRVIEIRLPSLRERREDLPLLVEHLLTKITRDQHKPIRYVSREALDLVSRYRWPGNVRELENAITRAVVHTKGEVLEADSLGITVDDEEDIVVDAETAESHSDTVEDTVTDGSFLSLREVEQKHITTVMIACKWNKRRACSILGITRQTLDRKIREYHIERPSHLPSPPSRGS